MAVATKLTQDVQIMWLSILQWLLPLLQPFLLQFLESLLNGVKKETLDGKGIPDWMQGHEQLVLAFCDAGLQVHDSLKGGISFVPPTVPTEPQA